MIINRRKYLIGAGLVSLMLLVPHYTSAKQLNYWQCTSKDQTNREWSVTNNYKKIAYNLALSNCKNQSQLPLTCMATTTHCSKIFNEVGTDSMWHCTAFDFNAQPWRSNASSQREEAALNAKAYCHQESSIPATCFINLITCTNSNDIWGG